ncbi:hypothetical protein BV898_19717 [Hypsibius exemplaris]|uniref:Uncharacterized protein n=1 Tax=Hypsibius exemplaris TaxID=2072580 RepID=A0A9X6NLZ0_HYPEX|nr:hypothetical protein BV898_19717 [Hypsibius exemplaris]
MLGGCLMHPCATKTTRSSWLRVDAATEVGDIRPIFFDVDPVSRQWCAVSQSLVEWGSSSSGALSSAQAYGVALSDLVDALCPKFAGSRS